MQEFLPHILVNHAFGLHQAVDMSNAPRVVTVEVQPGQPIVVPGSHGLEPISPEIRAAFKPGIQRIHEEVRKLQLRSSYETVRLMLDGLDQADYTVRGFADDASELHGRLVSELKYTTCFALWGKTEELYRAERLFGNEVAERFPSAAVDIEESGKCLALNRATACVFHLMRVMEVGLRALATSLSDPRIDPKTNPTWHNILKKGDDELQKPIAQRAPEWVADEKFFSEAQATLRAVQFAWRNPTMHVAINYDVEKAGDVMQSVKGFMRHLASKLHD
jgi:hypothetical protein